MKKRLVFVWYAEVEVDAPDALMQDNAETSFPEIFDKAQTEAWKIISNTLLPSDGVLHEVEDIE